jgi:hypothetical protein
MGLIKKQGIPSYSDGMPRFHLGYSELNYSDIYCSRAFFTLFYVKGNPIAFIKRLETGCIDSRMMNEYIRTVFLLDKTKTFSVIKPLHGSISHSDTPPFK